MLADSRSLPASHQPAPSSIVAVEVGRRKKARKRNTIEQPANSADGPLFGPAGAIIFPNLFSVRAEEAEAETETKKKRTVFAFFGQS